ncbi:MAG: ATP-dependent DNA helicase RecG [Dehalococcoidia bacterium]
MPVPVETLRRILKVEQSRGCLDTAVMGGLDKLLHRWAGQARQGITEPGVLLGFQGLHFEESSYATWDPERRHLWIEQALSWLETAEGAVVEATPPPQAVPAHPARPDKTAPTPPPPARRAGRSPRAPRPSEARSLDSPITTLPGVTPRLGAKLGKMGVQTVRDLLYFFPRRHLDRSQRAPISGLQVGEEQTLLATVWEARQTKFGVKRGTEAILGDDSGNIRAVWFNQPYLARRLPTNAQVVLSGRVGLFRGQKVFESPEWELLENGDLIHTGRLVPLYPLTEGLYPRQVRQLVKATVDDWAGRVDDFLPQEVRANGRLLDLPQAIAQAHYPDSPTSQDQARRRLAFDELFLLQLGVLSRKRKWQEDQPGRSLGPQPQVIEGLVGSLPFTLTAAQKRVLEDILADLARTRPMVRLLQGEVGSGKTVLAAAALLLAAANGYQGALMAPTEILAEQHFRTLGQIFGGGGQEGESCQVYPDLLPRPLRLALLTGSFRPSEKNHLQQLLAQGEIDIVVGTHALIQKGVEFQRLGLAVVDEQHRFGVLQRSALRQKGFNPHILVMTATPIPRTLALTLYGDLDLSVLDELPPGRLAVKTRFLMPEQRDRTYTFIREQVALGRQAFVICPLIEESEALEAKAAVAEYQRLSREIFPDLKLGLLHGRLSTADKDEAMRLFRSGELHILVSTSVVEVGIDVPNATVMLVEGADRFGLSQLHQFRGRVGRGVEQSYCLLLAQSPSPEARERLEAIVRLQDGFALAEEDLRLRGPGEFFGTRQSGLPDLRMARLSDAPLLEIARTEAIRLFEADPDFSQPQHEPLARELARMWQGQGEWS